MIETDRLLLRPHRLEDFEPWHAIFSDRELFRLIAAPALSREDGWNRLLRYAGHWSLLGFGMFAVLEREGGRLVGETGLADFHRGLGPRFDGAPEAAWIVARDAQGLGYAGEAAAAAHRWFAETKGRRRSVCIVSPENAPSLRVAERLGYRAFERCTYKGAPVTMLERTP
jgi:RimJ/RimL family protein N-acetyltransferase